MRLPHFNAPAEDDPLRISG